MSQAAAYGKCVAATTTGRQELKKDVCSKEFGALKTCFMNAVSDCQKHSTGFMSLLVFKRLSFTAGKEKRQMNTKHPGCSSSHVWSIRLRSEAAYL